MTEYMSPDCGPTSLIDTKSLGTALSSATSRASRSSDISRMPVSSPISSSRAASVDEAIASQPTRDVRGFQKPCVAAPSPTLARPWPTSCAETTSRSSRVKLLAPVGSEIMKLLIATLVTSVGLAWIAATAIAAATTIAPLHGDTAVAAYGGVAVWSDYEATDRSWHVVVRRNGQISTPPIP